MKRDSIKKTTPGSESVLEILIAQCADLEALVCLARRESKAARVENFAEVFSIVEERTTIGARLEVYQRQVMDLRQQFNRLDLGSSKLGRETTALIAEIQLHDAETKSLLLANRSNTSEALTRLDHNNRNSQAYLNNGRTNGLRYDRVG